MDEEFAELGRAVRSIDTTLRRLLDQHLI